jgi:hypothetical protein
VGGPGAAAEHGGDAGVEGVVDLLGADEVDVAVDAARGEDAALGGDDLRAGADGMVTPGCVSGLPALPIAWMRPSRRRRRPCRRPVQSRIRALVSTVSAAPFGAGELGLAHAVADDLAAAELDLLAVGGEVALDLDDQVGVGEADPVAGRGAVHVGVGGAGDGGGHGRSGGAEGRRRDQSKRRSGDAFRPSQLGQGQAMIDIKRLSAASCFMFACEGGRGLRRAAAFAATRSARCAHGSFVGRRPLACACTARWISLCQYEIQGRAGGARDARGAALFGRAGSVTSSPSAGRP